MFNKTRSGLFGVILVIVALLLVVPQVMAQEDEAAQIEFTGTITAISADGLTLTVDGLLVDVSAAETELTFEVGMVVKVEGALLEDGTVAASEVQAPDETADEDTGDDGAEDDVDSPDDTLEVVGTLDSLDGETAVVGGMTFSVAGAEIGEGVAVGGMVKVHASLSEDGTTWVASEIELYDGEDAVDEDSEDSADDADEDGDEDSVDDADEDGDEAGDEDSTGPCTFEVEAESASLRSGPGTGYGVVGYAYEGEALSVLETHAEGWYKVASGAGELWISGGTGELSGDCSAVPTSEMEFLGDDDEGDDSDDDAIGEDESGEDESEDEDESEVEDEDESEDEDEDEDESEDETEDETEDESGDDVVIVEES